MTPPAVSVVVPSYQAAPFLRATLDSVVGQSLGSWELIVVDDASTDGSWDIAQSYRSDSRVQLVRHDTNRGAAGSWNHALSLARAPYVKLLCSDDLIDPTCLERQVAVLDDDTSGAIGLVAARRNIIDAHGGVLMRDRGLPAMTGHISGRRAIVRTARSGANLIGEPSIVLFRRELLTDVGGFDADWKYVIDIMTYARVLKRSDFYGIDDTLGAFRVGEHQWSAALAASQGREFRRMIRAIAADRDLGMSRSARIAALARATGVATARVMVLRAASLRAKRRARRAS